jgi:undecaprenyl-diphosphatase
VRSGAAPAAAAALSLGVFAGLAVAAGNADGRLIGDGVVMDSLNAVAPVSSDDVHIDPVLDVATVVLGVLTAVLMGTLLVRRRFRAALYLPVAILGAVALSRVAKEVVGRPAIEGPPGAFTFPSGSATLCVAAIAAFYLLAKGGRERRTVLLAGVPFTLAYAAIIAWEEWHHPSDVLAGWCLGIGTATIAWMAFDQPSS